MAERLRLANLDQTTTVDLLSGTLKLKNATWETQSPSPNAAPGRVQETMDVQGTDTVANLLAGVKAVEDVLAGASLFDKDPVQYTSWWLEWNANGESEKRTLLYGGALRVLAQSRLNPMMTDGHILARLGLSRHALWENASATSISTTGLSVWGGKWTPTLAKGTANGRVLYFDVKGASGGGGPLSRIWVGVRPVRYGTSSFTAVWECESGTNGTDASDVADATASPAGGSGYKVQVSFATSTALVKRLGIKLGDVIAGPYYNHCVGRYLVLCRCKVSAGTIGLQMQSGFGGSATAAQSEELPISNTSWQLIPLGYVQIPPTGYRYGMPTTLGLISNFEISLYAERWDGAGTLDLDALCLIPAEHSAYMDGAAVQYSGGLSYLARVMTFENDVHDAVAYSAGGLENNLDFSDFDWYWPYEGAMVIVAAQRASSHELTDTVNIDGQVYPRWLSYRAS